MVGEALRDVGILLAVFYPLDLFAGSKPFNPDTTLAVYAGCICSLILGLIIERARKADSAWLTQENRWNARILPLSGAWWVRVISSDHWICRPTPRTTAGSPGEKAGRV
jgi:hypothetical protein